MLPSQKEAARVVVVVEVVVEVEVAVITARLVAVVPESVHALNHRQEEVELQR